jgi:asparagine synthase (glutamine-hydrolysing)
MVRSLGVTMCGISGVAVSPRSARQIDLRVIERMSAVLAHRGPDDSGLFVDGNIAVANRRLSIVDLPGGHQPMSSEDGALTVTYNGEIYNAPQIRLALEQRGRRYRTNCDTEALLHLYAEHGQDAVLHLRGCFAFALWDHHRREFFLARDRLGVKPLYFVHANDGSLYFASEIKALLAGGAVRPDINFAALPGYLANRATYGEQTIFKEIRRLLPGHMLLWRDGELDIKPYGNLNGAPPATGPLSDADYIAEWTDLFRESIRMRLMADVPLGVFLSGGIDSSAIAAVMSQLTDEPIRTFSVAFSERDANELAYARLVARRFETEHRDVIVTPEEFFRALPHLTWHADEPMGHPASAALYFLSELASRHVKAVLTGEGGDETLAGYARYRTTLHNLALGRRYERMTRGSWRSEVSHLILALPPDSRAGQRLSRTFLCRPADVEHLYFENFAVFSGAMQRGLLTPEAADRIGTNDPHLEPRRHFDAHGTADLLDRMLYSDCKTYLHGLLMKQDQMSMAASLESRVPFLDHELVALSARLPRHLKLHRGWTTKYVLRRSMEGVLPRAVLSRRKLGFPVPTGRWFRGPFRSVVDEYVLGERARRRGLFDEQFVRRLVGEHQDGARHGERLWALVSFELWARCFIDDEQPEFSEPELATSSGHR